MCTSCHGAGDGSGRGPQDCAVIGRPQMQSRAASWKQAGRRGFLTQLLSMLRAADSGFVGQQEGYSVKMTMTTRPGRSSSTVEPYPAGRLCLFAWATTNGKHAVTKKMNLTFRSPAKLKKGRIAAGAAAIAAADAVLRRDDRYAPTGPTLWPPKVSRGTFSNCTYPKSPKRSKYIQ